MNQLSTNPFYHRTPVRDPTWFFGRKQEMQQLSSLVRNGQSVALVGPRRIGKSSLLWQLVHEFTNNPKPGRMTADPPVRQCVVYFSGEAWQSQPSAELYAALWDAVGLALRTQTVFADLENLGTFLEIDRGARALEFSTLMRNLRQLTSAGVQVVFLLDEFDALSRNQYLDEFFFSSLRSLVAPLNVVFVTASTLPLLSLTYAQQSALSSPFFNIFLPHRLALLSERDASELLRGIAAKAKVDLNAARINDLLRFAGTHPFFLQIAGYHFWQAILKESNDESVLNSDRNLSHNNYEAGLAFFAEATPHWEYQWRYLTPDAQRTLALLSTPQLHSQPLLLNLEQECLIWRNAGKKLYLSNSFEKFVRQQVVHNLMQLPPILLDRQTQSVWLDSEALPLTPQDYRLLELLLLQPGQPISYSELAQHLWNDLNQDVDNRERLRTAVSSLRRKLGNHGDRLKHAAIGGYLFDIA